MTKHDLVGRPIGFEHKGVRLSGVITSATPAPNTMVGNIPDFTLTIRGKSGATITTSLVNSYSTLYD